MPNVGAVEVAPKLGAAEVAPNVGAAAPNAGVAPAPNVGAADVAPNVGAADVAPNAGVPVAPKAEVDVPVPNAVDAPKLGAAVVGVPNKPVDGCEVAVRPNPGVAGLKFERKFITSFKRLELSMSLFFVFLHRVKQLFWIKIQCNTICMRKIRKTWVPEAKKNEF